MCRDDSSAKMSNICEQAYSPSKIRALFEGFRSQAENSLLFLKSVTKLSVYVKAAGSQSPQLLFQATASAQVHSFFCICWGGHLTQDSRLRVQNNCNEILHH